MLRHRLHDPTVTDLELVDRLPPDIAERAVDRVRRETPAEVHLGDAAEERLGLHEEVQSDSDDLAAMLSPGVVTGSQIRGAIGWSILGGIGGAVIGALVGLIPIADLSLLPRVGLWILIGAMGGAAAGFVFGGGRQPELEGKVRDASPEVTITVRADDEATAATADEILTAADLEASERARRRAGIDDDRAFDRMTETGRSDDETDVRRASERRDVYGDDRPG